MRLGEGFGEGESEDEREGDRFVVGTMRCAQAVVNPALFEA